MFVLRAEIVTIFEPKMVTISARNTIQIWKLCKTIFSKLYNISQHFIMFFLAVFDSLLFAQIKI
jgi:hypothetical protein